MNSRRAGGHYTEDAGKKYFCWLKIPGPNYEKTITWNNSHFGHTPSSFKNKIIQTLRFCIKCTPTCRFCTTCIVHPPADSIQNVHSSADSVQNVHPHADSIQNVHSHADSVHNVHLSCWFCTKFTLTCRFCIKCTNRFCTKCTLTCRFFTKCTPTCRFCTKCTVYTHLPILYKMYTHMRFYTKCTTLTCRFCTQCTLILLILYKMYTHLPILYKMYTHLPIHSSAGIRVRFDSKQLSSFDPTLVISGWLAGTFQCQTLPIYTVYMVIANILCRPAVLQAKLEKRTSRSSVAMSSFMISKTYQTHVSAY